VEGGGSHPSSSPLPPGFCFAPGLSPLPREGGTPQVHREGSLALLSYPALVMGHPEHGIQGRGSRERGKRDALWPSCCARNCPPLPGPCGTTGDSRGCCTGRSGTEDSSVGEQWGVLSRARDKGIKKTKKNTGICTVLH